MVSVLLRVHAAIGVKVTLIVQAPLGVIVAPVQVSALLARSLAFVPLIVTVEMVRLAVPVLVTVTVWGALGGANVLRAEREAGRRDTYHRHRRNLRHKRVKVAVVTRLQRVHGGKVG